MKRLGDIRKSSRAKDIANRKEAKNNASLAERYGCILFLTERGAVIAAL